MSRASQKKDDRKGLFTKKIPTFLSCYVTSVQVFSSVMGIIMGSTSQDRWENESSVF